MDTANKLDTWDLVIIVIYFLIVLITGIISMITSKRNTVTGYFLAGRFMTWLPVGASLFASNIGSEHFIGLAGSGAAEGISVAAFELNAMLILQLLGWVFLPVYISSGVNLYAGSLFIETALNWNKWYAVLLLLGLTALITITGGLTAVLYTDTVQFFVMIIGSLVLMIISFIKVNGFSGLIQAYGSAIQPLNASEQGDVSLLTNLLAVSEASPNASLIELASSLNDSNLECSLPSPLAFRMLRGVSDQHMPWLGFLFGQTPASIWYWCADQMMVQRALSAKSLAHAQGGTLFAGIVKILPLFLIVLPGAISRVLYPELLACSPGASCLAACGHENGCSNFAFPYLVMHLLPSGLRGLLMAVMLAALVSDLTSIFNSSSTLFTVDLYLYVRKNASERELVVVGRIFVVILVAISIAWIPVVGQLQGSQLYIYIQSVASCLAPPIAAVYLLAVLWRRCNEKGAFYALCWGFLVGLTRFILEIVYPAPNCGQPDNRPAIIGSLQYMYFALISFTTCTLLAILVSLYTGKSEQVDDDDEGTINRVGFTYWDAWANSTGRSLPVIDVLEQERGVGRSDLDRLKTSTSTDGDRRERSGDDGVYKQVDETGDHSDEPTTKSVRTWKSMAINILLWLCCINPNTSATNDLNGKSVDQQKPQPSIAIGQSRTTKWLLRLALLFVVGTAVFCYIFFSLALPVLDVGPIPVVDSDKLATDVVARLTNASLIRLIN